MEPHGFGNDANQQNKGRYKNWGHSRGFGEYILPSSFPNVSVGDPFLLKKENNRFPTTTLGNDNHNNAGRQTLGDDKKKRPLIKVVLEGQRDKSVLPQKGTA